MTRRRVLVNDAITQRGASGTARVAELICRAVDEQGYELVRLSPPHSSSRAGRMLRFAFWDFYGPARVAGDVVLSPANTGRAGRRRPHILWVHDTMVLERPDQFDRKYAAYARAAFGASVSLATLVVVASVDAEQRLLERWPSLEGRTRAIPWPHLGPLAAPRAVAANPPEVLMLGATEPHKRHRLGIEALRLARLVSGVPIRLRIAGPPGRAEHQVTAALALVDPRRDWTVRETLPDRAAVDRALQNADVLLQCSSMEGFCLPLIEAAAAGLPVVHTGCGSMDEVHPSGSARSSDPLVLARALSTLLEPANYGAASQAGLSLMLRYEWTSFVAAIGELVEEACARRGASRQQ